jgi:hypothetical protein
VAVTLKRRDEQRQERLEPFSADPVGGLPQHNERLTHGLIVDRKTRSPAQPAGDLRRVEEADDVLAVIARDRDGFIEDPEFLFLRASSIPLPNRLQQVLTGFCADLPCHRALLGSATLVADFVRQRPPFGNRKSESMRAANLIDVKQTIPDASGCRGAERVPQRSYQALPVVRQDARLDESVFVAWRNPPNGRAIPTYDGIARAGSEGASLD